MKVRKIILILLLFLIQSEITFCQIIFDTLQLTELEIISSYNDQRSPIKRTTIDSIARKELNLNDIGELLAAYTPVFVKTYGKGSLSTVSFRGTGASHTKVLWEGFDINSPMLGQTDFSLLPGSFFDDVELLYGGSSLSESSGALGGSVNLSNKVKHNNQLINFQQSIGSFNTYQTSLNVNLKFLKLNSDTRIFRQSSQNDFTYLNNAILPDAIEMVQTNADFKNLGFTQQFNIAISEKQTISITTWNQWNNRNIPTIMTNIEKGGNQKEWQNDFFSKNIIKWNNNSTSTNVELKGAYFYENFNYYLHSSNSSDSTISLIDSRNKIESYSFSGNISSKLKNGVILKGGLKTDYQQVVSNNYKDTKSRSLLNGFISLKKDFFGKLTTEVLFRSEISDFSTIPIMPMLGINYKPIINQDLHFRLVLSRNQNIPSLNDLYWYPGGNENLKPEISLDSELGMDYATKINDSHRLSFSGSVYASSVKDWIIWLPGDYRYWSPENIANVFARGIELSLVFSGNLGELKYRLFYEYAYTRSTNNSEEAKENGTSDIQLVYVPVNTSVGYLNLNFNRYYTTWSLSYTGSRNTSLNNIESYSNKLPFYTLNNISIGKIFNIKKSTIDARFKINNIFNIDYQAVLWRAMPRRNYEFILIFKI